MLEKIYSDVLKKEKSSLVIYAWKINKAMSQVIEE